MTQGRPERGYDETDVWALEEQATRQSESVLAVVAAGRDDDVVHVRCRHHLVAFVLAKWVAYGGRKLYVDAKLPSVEVSWRVPRVEKALDVRLVFHPPQPGTSVRQVLTTALLGFRAVDSEQSVRLAAGTPPCVTNVRLAGSMTNTWELSPDDAAATRTGLAWYDHAPPRAVPNVTLLTEGVVWKSGFGTHAAPAPVAAAVSKSTKRPFAQIDDGTSHLQRERTRAFRIDNTPVSQQPSIEMIAFRKALRDDTLTADTLRDKVLVAWANATAPAAAAAALAGAPRSRALLSQRAAVLLRGSYGAAAAVTLQSLCAPQ
jgi:hypothetical protein